MQVESVKLLLEWGADPHIKDNDDCSAMEYAFCNGLTYMLRLLKVGAAWNHVCTLADHVCTLANYVYTLADHVCTLADDVCTLAEHHLSCSLSIIKS